MLHFKQKLTNITIYYQNHIFILFTLQTLRYIKSKTNIRFRFFIHLTPFTITILGSLCCIDIFMSSLYINM